MRDRTIIRLGLALLATATLACNAIAGQPEPLPPPPLPTSPAQTSGDGGPAIAATATLPGDATATGQGRLRVLVDLNVRAGPGVAYERVGFLLRDETATIVGRDATTGWWKIACPPQAEGSECWVSGGTQYTRAEMADVVPTAEVPPSPTPMPPEPAPGTGLLVYVDGGRLLAATLDLAGERPAAAPPAQLSSSATVQRAAVAQDGRSVAFTVLDVATGHNELRLVNADGGNERVLVRSADLPRVPEASELPAAANEDARVQVLDFHWRGDGTALAFNTALINLNGYSAGSQSDLWTVSTSGVLVERLAAGRGLPRFVLSAQDTVLLIGRQEIVRAGIDGTGLESVLTFDPLPALESFYYPAAQWSSGGAVAHVAIAEASSQTEGRPGERSALLWRISVAGPAEQLGRVRADVIAWPPLWTDDGGQVAFLRSSPQRLELWLANGDGSRPRRIAEGDELRPLDWLPGSPTLLFAEHNYVATIGDQAQAVPIPMPGERPGSGVWLSEAAFLVEIVAAGGAPGLYIVGRDGSRQLVAPLAVAGTAFDVWLP